MNNSLITTELYELKTNEIEMVSGGAFPILAYYGLGMAGAAFGYTWAGDFFGW